MWQYTFIETAMFLNKKTFSSRELTVMRRELKTWLKNTHLNIEHVTLNIEYQLILTNKNQIVDFKRSRASQTLSVSFSTKRVYKSGDSAYSEDNGAIFTSETKL